MKPVIVRTYSAGVHFGYLVERNGREVKLERSRRIWYWQGAMTLSELAMNGPGDGSKIACAVNIDLTEAIEIIDCSPGAAESILTYKEWKK